MNEEQKALREAVARAMYAATVTAAVDKELTVTWENEGARVHELYLAEASAAIALVLEEAARVIVENYEELCTEHRLLLLNRANAIRALKSSTGDTP